MKESIAVIASNRKVLKSQNTVLPIYSITKTMIASIVLDLEIDLESTISRWIPEQLCMHSRKIKVHQLMNHSSGIRDYGNLQTYKDDVEKRRPAWSDEEFIEKTINHELLFEPGTGFTYSNPGYWLLKRIIEIESGLPFDDLVAKYIAQPLVLPSIQVAHGIFDESLNGYCAEWVWHGLILANATDVAFFMASDRVSRLNSYLNKVGYKDEFWQTPFYGLGLMIEPGIKYGHLGGGPGYEAACIKFLDTDICACAILSSDQKINPLKQVIREKESVITG